MEGGNIHNCGESTLPETEDYRDESGFEFQPGIEVEASAGAGFFGEDFDTVDKTPVDGPAVQSGPAFTDGAASTDNPVDNSDITDIVPKHPKTKSVRERTLRPVPKPKIYKFKDGSSPTTRAQRLQYTRLCKKLGIPYDIAFQTILLFYNTKDLISVRMRELQFIIAFEELMDAYPENTTDILRILHLKTDKMYKEASDNFKDIHGSIEEIRKISGIIEGRGAPGGTENPGRPSPGLLARSLRVFTTLLRRLLRPSTREKHNVRPKHDT